MSARHRDFTHPIRRAGRSALLGVVALGFCGCALVGPQSITAGRGVYAEVINRTEDEQILNVMVRMRYDETFGMRLADPGAIQRTPVLTVPVN